VIQFSDNDIIFFREIFALKVLESINDMIAIEVSINCLK